MGYVSSSCDPLVIEFPFLVFLMAYIYRLCDLINDGISKKRKVLMARVGVFWMLKLKFAFFSKF